MGTQERQVFRLSLLCFLGEPLFWPLAHVLTDYSPSGFVKILSSIQTLPTKATVPLPYQFLAHILAEPFPSIFTKNLLTDPNTPPAPTAAFVLSR